MLTVQDIEESLNGLPEAIRAQLLALRRHFDGDIDTFAEGARGLVPLHRSPYDDLIYGEIGGDLYLQDAKRPHP
jgi:hypothetical protein